MHYFPTGVEVADDNCITYLRAPEDRCRKKCCTTTTSQILLNKMHIFHFLAPRWPWPLTLTFELGQDFCTVHLTAKFHHPTCNCSEVIMLTNRQTNGCHWKHPPRSAVLMLRRWVKMPSSFCSGLKTFLFSKFHSQWHCILLTVFF